MEPEIILLWCFDAAARTSMPFFSRSINKSLSCLTEKISPAKQKKKKRELAIFFFNQFTTELL